MSVLYDRIGVTYSRSRAADPRITAKLVELLGLPAGSRLIDIGAGTGNYSHALATAGFRVTAVEPSATMRSQAREHPGLEWQEGVGEALPYTTASFDGAIMTLCLHHFKDWQQGLREAIRVVGKGPLVVFTFDVNLNRDFWLFDYFPDLITVDRHWTATIPVVREFAQTELRAQFHTEPFPLPRDIRDLFAASGWARPELYFDATFRAGISSFSKLDAATTAAGLAALRRDLDNGMWQQKYGALLERESYDRGYLFMRLQSQLANCS